MAPVRLHAVQTPSKVLLPRHVARAAGAPVFFVVLHGFLAHSGAMNSFVVMLRNALDAHNSAVMSTGDSTVAPVPFHITTLDARNHGLSPHTSTHQLADLVEDLDHHLATDFVATVSRVSAAWRLGSSGTEEQDSGSGDHDSTAGRPRVVAVGHSMGSMTWTRHLMDCQLPLHTRGTTGTTPPVDVVGLVSLDMPPVARSHMTKKLTHELVDIIEHMKAVRLGAITDLRSGQEEFYRCGMQDIRVRGLCTTNLALLPDSAHGGAPGRRVARWKCNVPVLEHSIRSGDLFFPDSYYKAVVAESVKAADSAACRQLARQSPTVGTVPVLSVLGGASPVGSDPQYQQLWERHAVDVRQHTIPHATHTVYFDKPRETIEVVKGFLTDVHVL